MDLDLTGKIGPFLNIELNEDSRDGIGQHGSNPAPNLGAKSLCNISGACLIPQSSLLGGIRADPSKSHQGAHHSYPIELLPVLIDQSLARLDNAWSAIKNFRSHRNLLDLIKAVSEGLKE